jgi:hypothetical protein
MNKRNIVTLLTDFGDYYPGVMKGVILKYSPEAEIIDITHSVEPQNIHQGAFLLLNSYKHFPPSIHVAVVDPGVGTERDAVIVECDEHIFIAPDNGVIYPACEEAGTKNIWRIREESIVEYSIAISKTFHGRDVFAPATACYLNGIVEKIAERKRKLQKIDIFDYSVNNREAKCRVLFIDRFGNAVTNLRKEVIEDINPKAFYMCGQKFPLVKSYSDVGKGERLSIIGSFGTLELSLREGDVSKSMKISSGWLNLEFD